MTQIIDNNLENYIYDYRIKVGEILKEMREKKGYSQDKHIESLVFNAVWLCFVLHGVPLKRSVFHYQWEHGQEKGKIILDIHNPTTILSGEYNSPPPE